jgi:hypothetical protein
MKCIRVAIFAMVFASFVNSADWSSCADDLDRLRRAARDAADVASEVKSKAEEFENCKTYPDTHDLLGDRCRSQAYDYQSKLDDLKSELSTVASRVRSVNSSCGTDLPRIGRPAVSGPTVPSSGNRLCDLYRSYKDKLPSEVLLKSCTQSMSEADCRKCIGQ